MLYTWMSCCSRMFTCCPDTRCKQAVMIHTSLAAYLSALFVSGNECGLHCIEEFES